MSSPVASAGFFLKATKVIPQDYFNKVKKHFNGDEKKTWAWFQEINPAFGMLSPINLLKLKRESKLKEFIDKKMSS